MDDVSSRHLISAQSDQEDITMDGSGEHSIDHYRQLVQTLQAQRKQDEHNFGQKRAQFMDMYTKKEDELKQLRVQLESTEESHQSLSEELARLRVECDDIKTATVISETGRQDEAEALRRKYAEEIASMQHIMKESMAQSEQKLKDECARYQHIVKKLEQELEDTKQKLAQDVDGGVLSSVVKTLTKKVAVPLGASARDDEDENLEESMKKAQEDANLLKSVVLPLEAEIAALKEELHTTQQKLLKYEPDGHVSVTPSIESSTDTLVAESPHDLEEKIRELNKNLESEKSSRSDLEMYVAVLSAQIDKLREELHDSYKSLEMEKRDHSTLKVTWSVANDQFLQSQRLLMMDMTRMESLLSPQQQKTLEELKQADAEREAQEKRVRELEEKRKEEEKRRASESADQSDSSVDKTVGSLTSLTSEDFLKFDSGDEGSMRRSNSNQSFQRDKDFTDSVPIEDGGGSERQSPERPVVKLTQAQQKAIADTTFEAKLKESVLAGVKVKGEQISVAGKRLVSDNEWSMLQKELVAARERLGKPCDMCKNYESQLQQVQDSEKKAMAQARNAERQLENERSTLKGMQEYSSKLEETLKDRALEAQSQMSDLLAEARKQEEHMSKIQQVYSATQNELQTELKQLTEGREKLQTELRKLEEENDNLVAKHSKHSQQLQEETINLPENLEDMQLLLLKYREDIIAAKVAKEHQEELLKSEILFLKSQVVAEQQEKTTLEESLSNEISQLQEDNAILQSVKSELERQTKLRQEAESRGRAAEEALSGSQAKSKQLIHALQSQVTELNATRSKLENQTHEQKMKIQGLQLDLDNSEAVQRDFVKLSQSLQIQLEQIRSSSNEVRWQHEEDAEECQHCKKPFTGSNRKKNHCRHCGKIFCVDCLAKTVRSGPKMRPSKVCDVCHTILVQDATPYFSVEPPQTPD